MTAAGIWSASVNPGGQMLETCAILTTEANEVLRPIHDRMPAILNSEDYDLWLDDDTRKLDFMKELLRPYLSSEMISYHVRTLVNKTSNVGADLLAPMEINSA